MDDQQFFTWIVEKGFNLTDDQKKAVVYDKGPLLLLAVPGAGKTTVLTIRLAYLALVKKVVPERMLCLTFGRAGAREMEERFKKNFSDHISGTIHFSTIHSFAFEVARSALSHKGCSYKIMEEQKGAESKRALLSQLYKRINNDTLMEETFEELQNGICFVKNSMIQPDELDNIEVKNFATIYSAYEAYKLEHNPQLLDFDDMLSIAYEALSEDPQLLKWFQSRYDQVLCDESQDSSLIQHFILELITKRNGKQNIGNNNIGNKNINSNANIFVVGDDDQSIFGFRAASPAQLLNFDNTYEKAKILRLDRNFRSTKAIVNLSREFIRSNKERYDKEMVTLNPPGEAVQVNMFKDDREQKAFVLNELNTMGGSESAVLYRNNLSVITLVDELDRGGIPFYLRENKKERFFSHWVVKDIVNFLRFSYSDKNLPIFENIKSKLGLYINASQMAYLKNSDHERSVFDILSDLPSEDAKCGEYASLKGKFQALNKLSPLEAIEYIRTVIGYDKVIKRMCKSLGLSKEYIMSLLDILETIADREDTLPGFAHRLTYLEDIIKSSHKNKNTNAVTLSTIHSAKGLEWERVYIVDLIQGILPNFEAVADAKKQNMGPMEEECRLCYVAMTRAKKYLTLCTIKESHNQTVETSQFIKEIRGILAGNKPLAAETKPSESIGLLAEGLCVIHRSFGEGFITNMKEDYLTIRFKDGSERTLLRAFCVMGGLLRVV